MLSSGILIPYSQGVRSSGAPKFVVFGASIMHVSSSFSTNLLDGIVLIGGEHVAGLEQSAQMLSVRVAERDEKIRTLEELLAAREQTIQGLSDQLAAMSNSKIWRATQLMSKTLVSFAPPGSRRDRALRRLEKVALALYKRAKRIKNRDGGGMLAWVGRSGTQTLSKVRPLRGAKSQNLVDIDKVAPCAASPGRIGLHVHVFHPKLAPEFAGYFLNMPFPYDLFVSVPNKEAADACSRVFSGLPLCEQLKIEIVPNRGRDIAPLFCTFGKELMKYDFIAHLHSKKSGNNGGATAQLAGVLVLESLRQRTANPASIHAADWHRTGRHCLSANVLQNALVGTYVA